MQMNKTAVTIGLTIAAIGAFSLSILKKKKVDETVTNADALVRYLMDRYEPMTVAIATQTVFARITAGEYAPQSWDDLRDANEVECMLIENDM
jgi:hypothetical protein